MINYMELNSDDLFGLLYLPSGVDKNTMIGNIVMRGGEFPVLWANPDFVKRMIGVWSNKMQPTFERWVDTLAIDYDPLNNYDRHEDYTDTENTSGSASDTTTHKVTGYNGNTLVNNDQTEGSNSGSSNRSLTHSAHLYGNIGVTTSQEMLRQEMDVAKEFNIYDLIAEEFINEFCVRVW